jgi:homocysteine S-methyltransferase
VLRAGAPIVIDGGLATQCQAQGCDISGPLWSAKLLESGPDALIAATRAFLDAGAEIIATASYQASRRGCIAAGLGADAADRLLARSVEIAAEARDAYERDNPERRGRVLIAASIGPYGAALADGSEYRGDYRVPARELLAFHKERLLLLDRTAADVLACETVPSYIEAQVLGELLEHAETPAWVSFSCRDGGTISDGTPIEDAADLYLGHHRVLAVGVNCTPPQYITGLIGRIRKTLPDTAIVVYPNSGEIYDVRTRSWSGTATPTEWASAARTWIEAGARLIGGCCRTGPEHIAAIAASVRESTAGRRGPAPG